MKVLFLEEEKEKVNASIKYSSPKFISCKSLHTLKSVDILFVFDKSLLSDFITGISHERHNILETIDINFIIINDVNLFYLIHDNFSSILDVKFDECYKSKCIYRFFRVNDKKLFTVVKNFKNFYYIEDPAGVSVAIDGKRVSKCHDYFNDNVSHYERDVSSFLRYSIEKSKLNKIFLGRNFRVCYFDIETNYSVDAVNTPNEVLSIVAQDGLSGTVSKWFIDPSEGDLLLQEKRMLFSFFKYLQQFDAVTGWNILKFDCPYIINRAVRLGVSPSFMSLTSSPVSCKFKPDDIINPWFIKVIGLNLYDMMSASVRALAYLPEKLKDNKLDTVAERILGEKKLHTDTPAVLFRSGRVAELVDYNTQDTLLLKKLDEKVGISDLLISTLEFVPGLNLENSNYNSRIIDFYLLSKFSIIYPSVRRDNITDIEGAVVFDPVAGIHSNVAVADISSMYPSLVRTFNISPDTLVLAGEPNGITIHTSKCGDVHYTSSKKGILVKLVEDFTVLRKKYKDLKNLHVNDPDYKLYELRELAVKKILTSTYGIFGYNGFRLFDNRIANSITSSGQQLLYHMKAFAESHGDVVVAGDTDSLFIKSINGSDEYFESLISEMNSSLGSFVSKFTGNESVISSHCLSIEYETLFTKIIVAPAKKKYLGLAVKTKGRMLDTPVLFGKGNELVKKDVPDFIKSEIRDLVLDILNDSDNEFDSTVKKLKLRVRDIKGRIQSAKFNELLIWKEINRDFSSYRVKPQTVRAAENSNKFMGTDYSRLNYKGGILHVIPHNGIRVLFLNEYDDFNSSKFKINYELYFEKYVLNKINLIFGSEIYHEVINENRKLSEFF